jgi:hypothetical protein
MHSGYLIDWQTAASFCIAAFGKRLYFIPELSTVFFRYHLPTQLRIVNSMSPTQIGRHPVAALILARIRIGVPSHGVPMNEHLKRIKKKKPRVSLSTGDLKRLLAIHGTDSAGALAKRTGLPYMLVYNLVNRRIGSVSNRHYEILFERPAPPQEPLKIDGSVFRAMADLWLYLHHGLTRTELYRDLVKRDSHHHKADHRIFNGAVATIDARIEHRMRAKFAEAGVDNQLLEQWLEEFEDIPHEQMIPYARIRPALVYLQNHMGVHPKSVLHQSVSRYEKGELTRVNRQVFDRVIAMQQKAERVLQKCKATRVEKLKEAMIGGKPGYTLYADIEAELSFLCRYAGKSAKQYLGRSRWTYETGKAKRISNERAAKIVIDVERFIHQNPRISLRLLPMSQRRQYVQPLMAVLLARMSQLLTGKEGIRFEKRILNPILPRGEYGKTYHGFTPFDMASGVLGMKRKAFDLMVAGNCEIFRAVGKFEKRWYLSDAYLRELSKKKEFRYVLAKYETMARRRNRSGAIDTCLN